ncbi:hypothetical protein N7E81_12025 [Reichenbachiella carrageenanivorans]|uniref:40-residue YVTN family beta-propeller repeat-containing protein n=1 Tax=Reichenbachiella carrageenanivorans TaxID=2979869 RepID=A0ABY6CW05_9BACT|nr:DUF5074 domain-containing protein [Reichenbachiella carrageenanivorans]UXX78085.1 hypothetical protein N7E81_12025 [Reichenbachiella carrageenanivorans]
MKFNVLKSLSLILLSAILWTSCSDDNPSPNVLPGTDGFFIVNEGAFGNANASLSYFDKETEKVTNDLFYDTNNEKPLGDQAQSMAVFNDKGYIVVQNSAKVEVISLLEEDLYTNTATIDTEDGIASPRYFLGINENKAYISDWGADGVSGTIQVLDLSTNKITKSISVGQGTNRMILVGTKVYAANSGGWGYDNTIAIIDTHTDEKTGAITVGDNPNSLVADNKGNIWVASSGSTAYNADWSIDLENSTAASLSKINTDDEVEFSLAMSEKSYGASSIQINQASTQLYFKYHDGIYTLPTDATEDTKKITRVIEVAMYGFSIDPSTDDFLVFVAPDFSSAGQMARYNADGSKLDEFEVGIGPNSAAFN